MRESQKENNSAVFRCNQYRESLASVKTIIFPFSGFLFSTIVCVCDVLAPKRSTLQQRIRKALSFPYIKLHWPRFHASAGTNLAPGSRHIRRGPAFRRIQTRFEDSKQARKLSGLLGSRLLLCSTVFLASRDAPSTDRNYRRSNLPRSRRAQDKSDFRTAELW